MQLSKPISYRITFNCQEITSVKGPQEEKTFVRPVTVPGPKLYLVSEGQNPIYVGGTKRPIRERLRLGFQPNGNNGYRGYLWRHYLTEAVIYIWPLKVEGKDTDAMREDPSIKQANGNRKKQEDIVLETVEAEVVYLIRQKYGQWPKYQQEIHFHQAQDAHREAARKILAHYRSPQCPTA